jgi:hypothetical protein
MNDDLCPRCLESGKRTPTEDGLLCAECETLLWCPGCLANDRYTEVGDGSLCEQCEKGKAWTEWLIATLRQIVPPAKEAGWDVSDLEFQLDEAERLGKNEFLHPGRSMYFELSREVIDEDDESETVDSFKLRISDHGSCYCSEDVSLAMNASGDDHTVDGVIRRFQRGR